MRSSIRTRTARKNSKPKHKLRSRPIVPTILNFALVLIAIFIFSVTIYKITGIIMTNPPHEIAKLDISLADVTIETINSNSKDIKYPDNTVTLTINGQSNTFDDVEIKGRGNSTWIQPKKPYQLKFSKKTSLFNYGEARKWIILANYLDSTYIRNDLAFYLERMLDEKYALNGKFVEVYIDDLYQGLYYLTEKIEINKSRINLKDSLGIIMELDNTNMFNNTTEQCEISTLGNCLIVSDAVNNDNVNLAKSSFMADYNALESAVANRDYSTISKLIDVDSFAKYYLLNELAVNPDYSNSSFFLYKNGETDKIHAGPGWDFDFAFGNTLWSDENIDYATFHSPYNNMALKNHIANGIIYMLMDIPEFSNHVREIYQQTLSGKTTEVLDYIRTTAETIKPAAERDATRWKLKSSFDEEVDYLIDWVAKRFDHFEETYGTTAADSRANLEY